MDDKPYTTQLQAGLGLISETKTLLDLWSPSMSVPQLYQSALSSGRFPLVAARRLRNIVVECFAPRYVVAPGQPALHLKRLSTGLPAAEFAQLLFLFTCRANPILADFVRQVYWARYAGGFTDVSTDDARTFVKRAIDDRKTSKRWSDTTVRRMSAYLVGCCADYGMLERGRRSTRRIISFRLSTSVAAYLAYDLHVAGVADNALVTHDDWQLFGLARADVLEELKRLSLRRQLIVQAAGDVVRISWKYPSMEALCDVLTQG